jgi:hypothetical protein
MTVQQTAEIFAVLWLAVLGLSHLARPREWIEFFTRLRDAGDAGVFAVAILHLVPGTLIAATHNVWTGPAIVLTIVGWAWIAKASLYFLFPAAGRWGLSTVRPGREAGFRWAGVVLLAVAGLLAWNVTSAQS